MSLKGPGGVVGMGMLPRGDEGYAPCTHYASATGVSSNNGLTVSTPFRPRDFWGVAGPDRTLCLLDGTYQGSNFLLDTFLQVGSSPPSGTSDALVTIRALHDGAVLFDGQGGSVPLRVSGSRHYVFEGFDACCAGGDGNVISGGNLFNVTFRRMIAWDSEDLGGHSTWSLGGGSAQTTDEVVMEDVAAFGIGRKNFHCLGCLHWTTRRGWARHGGEGGTTSHPRTTLTVSYGAPHVLHENDFLTWSEEDVLNPFGGEGCFATDGAQPSDPNPTLRVLGGFAYYLCGVPDVSTSPPVLFNMAGGPRNGTVLYQDVIGGIESGCWTNRASVRLHNPFGTGGNAVGTATRISGFGGDVANFFVDSDWVESGINSGATVADIPNPFTGSGAKVCHRYIDGVLTNEPIWPWPMDQRIKSALSRAGRLPLKGSAQTVTSEIEYMLGPIPAECRKPA